ncbi:MAG: DMT family transporter [SAR116 cluster bacterium]|nr:MAG: DMT family transporter [SAR116 cluster bacterium]
MSETPFSFVKDLLIDGVNVLKLPPDKRHKIAVALILFSSLSMACMMVLLKLGAERLSLWQIITFKSLLPMLVLLAIFWVKQIKILPHGYYGLYLLRVILAVAAVVCWIYSITYLPLGIATVISFTKGIFVLWLATVFLSERLTAIKIITTVVGCIGSFIIMDISKGGPLIASLVGLAGALFAALLSIIIKKLAASEPTVRLMFYPQAGMTLFFFIPAALNWQPMDGTAIVLASGIGLFGLISQWCFISAYRLTDVSALAPIEYSRLIFAVLTGALIFSEIPSHFDIIGMLLIVGSSYVAFRFGPRVL